VAHFEQVLADLIEHVAVRYVIDVADRGEAVAWAMKNPVLAHGTVELRPLADM
jgi:hypothetical protein